MMRKMMAIVFLAMFALLVNTTTFGQAVYGNIVGTVTDPQGSAVAGARVIITDTQRQTTVTTVTNNDGNFTQRALIAGIYQVRAEAAEAYDRNYHPWGISQQFSAIMGSGSLLHYDRRITAPTVVIHGTADKLMRPFGGRAVAKAINGARLVLVDGMGHDLPKQLWSRVIGELTSNFDAAG